MSRNSPARHTTFFPIVVFGKRGERAAEYIHKGRQVLVEDRLDVAEKGYFNVVAENIVYGVNLKREEGSETGHAAARKSAGQLRQGRTPARKKT